MSHEKGIGFKVSSMIPSSFPQNSRAYPGPPPEVEYLMTIKI